MTFPEAVGAREAYILQRIQAGGGECAWVELTSTIPGHTASLWVMADALKVDGVRVTASAKLEQQIADVMLCSLLTPKLADLIFLQAQIYIKPLPIPITSTTAAMISHSAAIDAEIAKTGQDPFGALVGTVGKHWVLDNDLLQHPGRAENYGWHFRGTDWPGPTESSVTTDPATGKPIPMIQGRGWAHDVNEDDYSQTVMLVDRYCLVDGCQEDIRDVMADPNLCALVSHQGVLKVFRQPGVAELSPV